MLPRLLGLVLLTGIVAACTSSPAAGPSPVPSTRMSRPEASSTTKPPALSNETQESAILVYSSQGSGPAVLTPGAKGNVISVRFTCIGHTKAPSLKSVGGGTIMSTGGCLAGEIFGATFTRSARLNPAKITLTVDPGTVWQIQVWQGKYVQHTGVPAETAAPIPST
jgi:hypothetical protein